MKKYFTFLTVILSASILQAQEISDALRYAQNDSYGTARFRAMSGAFGALGGDLSTINVNPAGSAVFATNQVVITGNINGKKNSSNYFGTKTTERDNSLDIVEVGGIFVFKNRKEENPWKKFAIGINYENLNSYENSLFSAGINPTSSATQYFVNYANGIKTGDLDYYYYDELDFGGQQASLAYQTYLINPVTPADPDNTSYTPNIAATGNYYQENETVSSGYNGKLSVNAATLYKDKLYLGANLNVHFTDYTKSTSFYEDYYGATNADATTGVQAFRFNNDLHTYGNGFSFQFGAIAKLTNEFRLGLAYESPTWLTLTDELAQNLATDCADCPQPSYYENPGIINVYEPYHLQTPDKWTGSLAYVFGKTALLSVDVSTKDYANTKFSPKNEFRGLNTAMANNLTRSNEVRVGGEYKIKQVSLRGGYRWEGTPYRDENIMGDLTGFSTGIGYNFGHLKIDMAYANSKRDYGEQFFSQGMTDRAKINAKNNNITISAVIEF